MRIGILTAFLCALVALPAAAQFNFGVGQSVKTVGSALPTCDANTTTDYVIVDALDDGTCDGGGTLNENFQTCVCDLAGTWVPEGFNSGDSGTKTFEELTDTPAVGSYTGSAGQAAIVNEAEDGLIFEEISASADSLRYRFSTGTGSNPATGRIQLNNADPALTTLVYVHETTRTGDNPALILGELGDTDQIVIDDLENVHVFAYQLTGPGVLASSVYTYPVAHRVSSDSGDIANQEEVTLGFRLTAILAFTDLVDTPSSYSGDALKVQRVNAGESAIESVDNTAAITTYDNGASSLAATDVKAAVDELDAEKVDIVDQFVILVGGENGVDDQRTPNNPVIVCPNTNATCDYISTTTGRWQAYSSDGATVTQWHGDSEEIVFETGFEGDTGYNVETFSSSGCLNLGVTEVTNVVLCGDEQSRLTWATDVLITEVTWLSISASTSTATQSATDGCSFLMIEDMTPTMTSVMQLNVPTSSVARSHGETDTIFPDHLLAAGVSMGFQMRDGDFCQSGTGPSTCECGGGWQYSKILIKGIRF